jgi:hypothetical protein
VLLQLRHTGPCASVCLKALTDAGRCRDVAWSVQLLRLQAAAFAAQEDYVGALNSCRTALARCDLEPGIFRAYGDWQCGFDRMTQDLVWHTR